jgi:hypothetical protein
MIDDMAARLFALVLELDWADSALEQHLCLLEGNRARMEILQEVHARLMAVVFFDVLNYMEASVVGIFNRHRLSAGAPTLLPFYLDTLTDLCVYMLRHMAKPPDFVIPG